MTSTDIAFSKRNKVMRLDSEATDTNAHLNITTLEKVNFINYIVIWLKNK